eukprot:jgi/Galph1/2822/GphlegSOOS_G1469.1
MEKQIFILTFILLFLSGLRVTARFEFLGLIPNGHRLYSLNLSNCQAIGHLRQTLNDPYSWCEPGNGLNQFGRDFLEAGMRWTRALCEKDSDGDGLSNGVELGDPCCFWTEGDVPYRLEPLSLPNDKYSTIPSQYDIVECRTDIIFGVEPTVTQPITPSVQNPQGILHSPTIVASPSAESTLPVNQVQDEEEEQTPLVQPSPVVGEKQESIPSIGLMKKHASLEYASVALLMVFSVFSCRYLKPVIGETWWLYAHVLFLTSAFACCLSGIIIMIRELHGIKIQSAVAAHNVIGLVVLGLLFICLLNGLVQLLNLKNMFGTISNNFHYLIVAFVTILGLVEVFLGFQNIQNLNLIVSNLDKAKFLFIGWIIFLALLLPAAELCFLLWRIAGGEWFHEPTEDSTENRVLYMRAEKDEYTALQNNNQIGVHVLEGESDNEEESDSPSVMNSNTSELGNNILRQHPVPNRLSHEASNEEETVRMDHLTSLWLWLRRLPWIIGSVAAVGTIVFDSILLHLIATLE